MPGLPDSSRPAESPILLTRLAPDQSPRAPDWSEALRTFRPELAPAIKRDADAGVFRARLAGHDAVVKLIPLASPWARIKALARHSRAWRQWRGTLLLERLAIPTAPILALARRARPPAEVLVMAALPGQTALWHLAQLARRPDPARERALVAAVARTIGTLHAAGYLNRDGKPSNLIISPDAPPAAAIIDAVAIRRAGADADRSLARMLASLVIEPIGCGIPPRRALCRRTLRAVLAAAWAASPGDPEDQDPGASFARWERASARHLWTMARGMVAAHPDPRPRVNPLTGSVVG